MKNLKTSLTLTLLLTSMITLSLWSISKPSVSTPNTLGYEYIPVVVSPDYEPFHDDYDSTFTDATTDCIHLTFKNSHNCEFIKNNPEFK